MNLYALALAALLALLFSPYLGSRLWAEVQYALSGKVRWQLPVWTAVSLVVVVMWAALLAQVFHLYTNYWWAALIALSFALLLVAPSVSLLFARKKIPTSQVKPARGGGKSRAHHSSK
jgi:hypothetical protein